MLRIIRGLTAQQAALWLPKALTHEVTAAERQVLLGQDDRQVLEAEAIAAGKLVRLSEYRYSPRRRRRERVRQLCLGQGDRWA